jgi:hypothetical protein
VTVTAGAIVECGYEDVYVLHESVTAMNLNVWCEWERVRRRWREPFRA